MKNLIYVLISVFLSLTAYNANAQDILKAKDLSTFNADALTEAELANINSQLKSNNTTLNQVEQAVLAKGMSQVEFNKLRKRLNNVYTVSGSVTEINGNGENGSQLGRSQEPIVNRKVKDSLNSLIFGSELFDNPSLNFEPNLKLATPTNYILGPGDILQVNIFGVQEFNTRAPVSAEGRISIQYVGQISVAGITVEAATQKIKNEISKVYSTVKSGQSNVSVSLDQIRTIRITVIGGKQPGNYSISSLATVYNALHLAGGPGKNGSYRNIELIRNNKVFRNIDIYRFLVNGDQSDNVGLKDNDVIRIPSYSNQVTLKGEVKRPGIFEMKNEETFSDLLTFASGFNEFAYRNSVNIEQKTGREYRVRDLEEKDFVSYFPQSGDVFTVTRILNRYENRIRVEGAVFRPGHYSFEPGMRISDLITRVDGLKEDAYTQRARIIRLKPDLSTEIVNVDLSAVLAGDNNADIELKREDELTIYSILDFKEEYKVTIDGEVKRPGSYMYFENLTLNDLFIQAGGLTGSASKRVEIARMIKSDDIKDIDSKRIELVELEITAGNNEQIKNFVLKPFDVINVRRIAVYEMPNMVKVTGEVIYPGKYVLANKKENVFNIVMRAGGITSVANINGMKIKRPINQKELEQINSIDVNLATNDSLTDKLKKEIKFSIIPIDWEQVLKNRNHYSNVTLFPGDEIEVSAFNEGVKVAGNVLLTSEIPYQRGKGLKYYINAVGGVNNMGWKKKAYIIYPNGKAAVTKSFLFFRSYPKVFPDSQIIVPEKPETKKLSTGEWVSITGVFTSLALLIITAFR